MRSTFRISSITASLLGFLWIAAQAAGISTPFVDVTVDKVPLGKPFLVTHSAGNGITIANLDNNPVQVSLEALSPKATELRGGAIPVPSVEWVHIEPIRNVIPAHGQALYQVTLTVPKLKEYAGQYYQVMIWSRGEVAKNQGVGITAGLISRLRFHTIKE